MYLQARRHRMARAVALAPDAHWARCMAHGRLRIGTSGWEYQHWRGDFYPDDLPKDGWLEHYARTFATVELNASFYRLPPRVTFERWARRVPDDFVFSAKASRYLTHLKRLREPGEPLDRFWTRATGLGSHLGPVLYQLPPRWKPNLERLAAFLAVVPPDRPQVVEIRDRRWYGPALDELLEQAGVALCLHDMAGSGTAGTVGPVGPFVYLRLHGSGARYGGRYPDAVLDEWAARLRRWTDAGRDAWVYFNNDIGGHAPRDALRLIERASGR
jgi:uncharacterized protein YecE (DUF72 family)